MYRLFLCCRPHNKARWLRLWLMLARWLNNEHEPIFNECNDNFITGSECVLSFFFLFCSVFLFVILSAVEGERCCCVAEPPTHSRSVAAVCPSAPNTKIIILMMKMWATNEQRTTNMHTTSSTCCCSALATWFARHTTATLTWISISC